MRELLPSLVQDKQEFSLTTDAGKEFSQVESAIGEEAVHREKKASNDIAVIDRQCKQ